MEYIFTIAMEIEDQTVVLKFKRALRLHLLLFYEKTRNVSLDLLL